MFIIICQLICGLICGFLVIKWIPFTLPIELSELFVSFVLDPVEFFAASVVFIIGTIIHGNLIKYIFTLTVAFIRKQHGSYVKLILSYGAVVNFLILFKLSFWHALAFLCFSFVYGMISIDFSKGRVY
ncbi:hypothetical protein [Neobacillus sp. LXY-4]|uniref:hypothetical protein n=1 Tax=Neobacillus sp. LXY-4 TaxID=3379826 RepID=UPI003EE04470